MINRANHFILNEVKNLNVWQCDLSEMFRFAQHDNDVLYNERETLVNEEHL